MEYEKVEIAILKALTASVKAADGSAFVEMIEGLIEEDETFRLREVVFHIDQLIEKGQVAIKTLDGISGYTDETDSISIKYLNSAVALYPERLEVTAAGLARITGSKSSTEKVVDKPAFAALTYVVTFLLGMASMYVILTVSK